MTQADLITRRCLESWLALFNTGVANTIEAFVESWPVSKIDSEAGSVQISQKPLDINLKAE